jgi:uncharacterized protein (TIGR03083 family)
MATELTIDDHLAGLAGAVARGSAAARAAGLDAAVPTCPAWDVRELVAHVGMVHRWAAAHLDGRGDEIGSGAAVKQEGRDARDPIAWWAEGADELAAVLRAAPEDVAAMVFLHDAPPPRRFWARRQCHEATIHAVDAQAAQLGRAPTAAECGLGEALALDGLDELLTGFLTRGRKLAVADARTLAVRPDGDRPSWTLTLSSGPAVAMRHPPGADVAADDVLTGSAVALYLALWNRGDEIAGDAATLTWWREVARIRWS